LRPIVQESIADTGKAYFTALQCGAEYGSSMDSWLREKVQKALKNKNAAREVAKYLAEKDITQRYLLQTSQAVDLISGGVKINALPEKVHAVVNHRVAVESTIKDIRTHLSTLVQDKILSKHDLSLDAWGSVSGNTSSSTSGQIFLQDFDEPLEPSPVSPYTTDAYKVFSGTIKQVFGEDIIVAPALMTGNTDTKYYWNLTENIYRFSAVREGGRANAHTVNERIGMKEHVEGVKFYAQIILNGDGE
jgi:Gly-Xaa carboxypeptidase